MHANDVTLAHRQRLEGVHDRGVRAPALGRFVGTVFAVGGRKALERLGFHRYDQRPGRALLAADAGAHAARSPIVPPELVDDGAANARPEIALEVFVAQVRPALQGVDETEHARGLEVFALHAARRDLASDLANDPGDDVAVLLDGFLHEPRSLQRSGHAKTPAKARFEPSGPVSRGTPGGPYGLT
ncbi:MAG TPA: hypothetical protein VF765_24045 [Polyangiaceae bacterium]